MATRELDGDFVGGYGSDEDWEDVGGRSEERRRPPGGRGAGGQPSRQSNDRAEGRRPRDDDYVGGARRRPPPPRGDHYGDAPRMRPPPREDRRRRPADHDDYDYDDDDDYDYAPARRGPARRGGDWQSTMMALQMNMNNMNMQLRDESMKNYVNYQIEKATNGYLRDSNVKDRRMAQLERELDKEDYKTKLLYQTMQAQRANDRAEMAERERDREQRNSNFLGDLVAGIVKAPFQAIEGVAEGVGKILLPVPGLPRPPGGCF